MRSLLHVNGIPRGRYEVSRYRTKARSRIGNGRPDTGARQPVVAISAQPSYAAADGRMPFLRVLPFRRVTNVILVAPGAAAVPFSGDGSIPWSPSRYHPVDPLLLLEDDLARAASTRSRSENLGRRELADVRGAVGKELAVVPRAGA